MGEVPINPTGFAHGFRPLEGDHPPPTPTQRDINPHFVLPGGFLSATTSQQHTPAEGERAHPDAVGVGLGSTRKKRRLPGPLAFLQQGASGGMGQQESGGASDDDNTQRRSDESDPDEGEAGGGHFRKGPWLSMCSAVDAPIAEEGASDTKAVQAFLRGAVSPMSEVLSGHFDLRVPVVMAVIDVYTKLSISDVVVELVDPSGRIKGHLHPGCLEEHGPSLGPGAALLLKQVSIFVSGPGTTRLLNVHPDCILAVFPADTPLPTPSRLEWLITCDPPFTPWLVSDPGGDGSALRESSRRTPPRSTTWTSRASGQRRPRPPAAREDPEDQSQQSEQQVAPRSTPPPPLASEPLRGKQRQGHHQEQEQTGPRRKEQLRREPTQATPGSSSPTPNGEALNTPSLEPPRGGQLLPPSPSPPPSSGCPSPPGMFSQSQSQQQIPLGQHSTNEKDEHRVEQPEASGVTLLSGAFVDSVGDGGEHDDSTGEDRYPHGRRRTRATISTEDGRGGVGNPSSSLRRPEGGRGHASAASGTGTQQVASALTAAAPDDVDHGHDAIAGGGGDGGGEDGEYGVDGDGGEQRNMATEAAAAGTTAALGDSSGSRSALPPRPQGDVAGSKTDRRVAASPGNVAGGLARSKHDAKPTPADHDDMTEARMGGQRLGGGGVPTAGVEDADSIRPKIPGASSSIWADLDGFASADDSSSGDENARSTKAPCAPVREGSSVPRGQRQPLQQQHTVGAEREESGGGRGDVGGASSLLSKGCCRSPSSSPHNTNDDERGVMRSSDANQGAPAVAAADDHDDGAVRRPLAVSESANAAASKRYPSSNTVLDAPGNTGRGAAAGAATGVNTGTTTADAVFGSEFGGVSTATMEMAAVPGPGVGRGSVTAGSGGFSLLGGGVGILGDDELLDAALDDDSE